MWYLGMFMKIQKVSVLILPFFRNKYPLPDDSKHEISSNPSTDKGQGQIFCLYSDVDFLISEKFPLI